MFGFGTAEIEPSKVCYMCQCKKYTLQIQWLKPRRVHKINGPHKSRRVRKYNGSSGGEHAMRAPRRGALRAVVAGQQL